MKRVLGQCLSGQIHISFIISKDIKGAPTKIFVSCSSEDILHIYQYIDPCENRDLLLFFFFIFLYT